MPTIVGRGQKYDLYHITTFYKIFDINGLKFLQVVDVTKFLNLSSLKGRYVCNSGITLLQI
jgi:hypothetical protein